MARMDHTGLANRNKLTVVRLCLCLVFADTPRTCRRRKPGNEQRHIAYLYWKMESSG